MEEQLKKLEKIYAKIPETLNCNSCGKCCEVQHPHGYYIEFINIYNYILKNWTDQQLKNLHINCIKNYLSNEIKKKCIFLRDDKLCSIHPQRNFNCRMFGNIPEKTYKKRVKKTEKKFPGINLDLKKQTDCCSNVRPKTFISEKKIDKLFNQIFEIDEEIGVSEEDLKQANNYMTFHDHYILHIFGNNLYMLQKLTHLKINGTEKEKNEFIKAMEENLS